MTSNMVVRKNHQFSQAKKATSEISKYGQSLM